MNWEVSLGGIFILARALYGYVTSKKINMVWKFYRHFETPHLSM